MKKTTKDTLLMALMVFVLVGSGFVSAGAAMLRHDVFLDGSSINGVDISGLTPQQAEKKILEAERSKQQPVGVTVACEGQSLRFTEANTGQQSTADQSIHDYLFNIEKGTAAEKYDTLLAFRKEVSIDYEYEYDKQMITAELEQFAKQFEKPALDAFLELDIDGMGFTYKPEQEGRSLDVGKAAIEVYERLKKGGDTQLVLSLETQQPTITLQQLEEDTKLIGSCSTEIDGGGKDNIDLVCEALNGSVIKANDVISLNSITGVRSPENGYSRAQGDLQDNEDEYGGGANQVASTLYSAALAADMEIVERNRQSAPAGYIEPGLDAIIDNSTNKDLIIKNVSDMPAYIFAKRDGSDVTVEVYGKLARPEYQMRVETEVLEWIPPGEPEYVYDPELGEDEKMLEQQEHEGVNVIVWRKYYGDDPENAIEEKRVSTDTYQPVKGMFRTGDQSLTTK